MKQKREVGVTTRGAGASGSNSGSSHGRPTKTPSKEGGGKRKKPATQALSAATGKKKINLTAIRVAHIIGQLDNKRGSTMDSIRGKLIRSGYNTNTSLIRNALDRAVKSGLLREIREERFSLPSHRLGSNTNSSSSITSSSRTSAKAARRVASKAQNRKLAKSSSRTSRRRQRRPPQGRRPANSENEADEDDEGRDMHDDDDTGVGDGDVEAENSGSVTKNPTAVVCLWPNPWLAATPLWSSVHTNEYTRLANIIFKNPWDVIRE